MKVVAYIRVSTMKQAEEGFSLDAQKAKLNAYASLYDLDIIEYIVDEGKSASSLEREGLNKALALLGKENVKGLIIAKLDRLTRSVKDLGYLIDIYFNQYQLLSVTEQIDTRSAGGRLVLNVLMSVAQWEREVISERTKQVLCYKKDLGEHIGGNIPYGFYYNASTKRLEKNIEEQITINKAKHYRSLQLSYRRIAEELYKDNRIPRKGNLFSAEMVKRMVNFKEFK